MCQTICWFKYPPLVAWQLSRINLKKYINCYGSYFDFCWNTQRYDVLSHPLYRVTIVGQNQAAANFCI